jgi:N-acetylglucosaminyl-diphospho-decaprenol L-rhamnosyltransferase
MMTSSAPDLSISIVSLNRPDLVEQCLASIEAVTRSIAYEVHLVAHNFDVVPLDQIRRRHPSLIVHRVAGIRGYSQNNNVALRAARGRHVAILNDDTILGDDLFGKLVQFLDCNQDITAVCPVLQNSDGSLQMGYRGRFTPLAFIAQQLRVDRLVPVRWAVRLGAFDRPWLPEGNGDPVEIEAGTGACFVARREALKAIGFLDEDYFLGPDDIDWTIRLRRLGRVVLLPDASLTHLAGATLRKTYYAVLPAVYAGCYTFFRRHYGRGAEWAIRLALGCVWSFMLSAAWGVSALLLDSAQARSMKRARWNCVRFAFSRAPSPDVFARLMGPGGS